MTLTFAKCSVLALIRRIIDCKPGKSEPFCIGLMVITVLWGATSSVSFLINCNPSSVLTVENLEQCPHQVRNLSFSIDKSNKTLTTDIPLAIYSIARYSNRTPHTRPHRTIGMVSQYWPQSKVASRCRIFISPASYRSIRRSRGIRKQVSIIR